MVIVNFRERRRERRFVEFLKSSITKRNCYDLCNYISIKCRKVRLRVSRYKIKELVFLLFDYDDNFGGFQIFMIILFLSIVGIALFISDIFKGISGFFQVSFSIIFIILVLIIFVLNLIMESIHSIRILTFIELIGDMVFWIPTIFFLILTFSEFKPVDDILRNVFYVIGYIINIIISLFIVFFVTCILVILKSVLVTSENVFFEFLSTIITYVISVGWVYLIIKLMESFYNNETLESMQKYPSYVIDIIRYCIKLKIK